MKTNKEYRFKDNPEEKIYHDEFIDMFTNSFTSIETLSSIIFGWKDGRQNVAKERLTEDEENICLNLIQWLGSPIGQSFVKKCQEKINSKS